MVLGRVEIGRPRWPAPSGEGSLPWTARAWSSEPAHRAVAHRVLITLHACDLFFGSAITQSVGIVVSVVAAEESDEKAGGMRTSGLASYAHIRPPGAGSNPTRWWHVPVIVVASSRRRKCVLCEKGS